MDDLKKITSILICDAPEYVKVIRFKDVKITETGDNERTYEVPKPSYYQYLMLDYSYPDKPIVLAGENEDDVSPVIRLEVKGKDISADKFAKGFMKALETVAKDEQQT